MNKYLTLSLLFTAMFAINSCAKDEQTISKQDWEEITFLRYDFTDSSLPPEHHRSYYIGIDKDSIRVRVSCYGELLRREVFPSSQAILDKAKATLATQNIRKVKPKDEALICGGTTDALAFFKGNDDKAFFSASIYGGVGSLSMNGDPAAAFRQALPVSIESIIDKTRRHPHPPIIVIIPEQKADNKQAGQSQPEVQPTFPGGNKKMQDFLSDELNFPLEYFDKETKVTMKVSLVIDEDGRVDDAWVNKGFDQEIDSEVVRSLKEMPQWIPGTRGGKAVAMIHELPITIVLRAR